jgi:hypothetical protein
LDIVEVGEVVALGVDDGCDWGEAKTPLRTDFQLDLERRVLGLRKEPVVCWSLCSSAVSVSETLFALRIEVGDSSSFFIVVDVVGLLIVGVVGAVDGRAVMQSTARGLS